MKVYNSVDSKDTANIMSFIDCNFKNGHRLSYDLELFNWMYESNLEKLNFSCTTDNEVITSILGYIPPSKWQRDNDLTWLALWSSKQGTSHGLALLMQFMKQDYVRKSGIGILGLSEVAKNIYLRLGFEVGVMNHYFIRNPELKSYDILNVSYDFEYEIILDSDIVVKKDTLCNSISITPKEREYLERKYLNNPFRNYEFITMESEGSYVTCVTRENQCESALSITIVDIVGDIGLFDDLCYRLIPMVIEYGYEYVDFLCNKEMKSSLWEKSNAEHFAPLYFSPFEKKYVPLEFAIKSDREDITIFKADGDQERP